MSACVKLGVHLGFAINRYPEPMEWARVIAEDLGIRYVQFVSDLLQPNYPKDVVSAEIDNINEACDRYKIQILHTFTSPRYNFFGHPEDSIRDYWLSWFREFVDISRRLGAISTGSLLGIYSVNDLQNRKDHIFDEVVRCWHELADSAKEAGLEYLTWEPMSIPREMGETIINTENIHHALNGVRPPAVPIRLCLDLDHGDVSSSDPEDVDPYAWIKKFGSISPVIHIKQRTKNLFSHKPFIPEYNEDGVIFPDQVIEALEDSGASETMLFLELGFRERQPYESSVVAHLKESVEFWRPYCAE